MEQLKELLGEELFEQVKSKLGDKKILIDDKNFIPKSRFDAVNDDKNKFKELLEERDKQLSELKEKLSDNEELQTKIKELEETNANSIKEYEAKIYKKELDFLIDKTLSTSKSKNNKAVLALFDMDQVKLEEGKLIGFEEQLTKIKEENPYLFGTEGLKGKPPMIDGLNPTDNKNNPWSKSSFNLTKQGEILRKDPELAKKLMMQAK